MKILGFQSESFQDWDEGLCSIIYTGNCNFRCSGCHAGSLIKQKEELDEEEILARIRRKLGCINKVVVCGGEPTLEPDLPAFINRLKQMGARVKLDTNGSNPVELERALNVGVDYVAMDIKSPRELYAMVTGTEVQEHTLRRIEESMRRVFAVGNGRYEFRTTMFPILNADGGFRWMTADEVRSMCEWIERTTGKKQHRHYIQRFVAREKGIMIDERFSKERISEDYRETPAALLKDIVEKVNAQGYGLLIR
jgi:pyruvate formate lyase activating enzyme